MTDNPTYIEKIDIGIVTGDYVWSYDIELNSNHGNSYGNYILEAAEIQHL
jgi:hypothetical protein